jgi:hypothetical protein
MALTDGIKLTELALFGQEYLSKELSSLVITSHVDYLKDATIVLSGETISKPSLKNCAKTMSVFAKTFKYGAWVYPFIKPLFKTSPLTSCMDLIEKSINTGSRLFKSASHALKVADQTNKTVEKENWSFTGTAEIITQIGLVYIVAAPVFSSNPPLFGAIGVLTSSSALFSFLGRFGSSFFDFSKKSNKPQTVFEDSDLESV